MTGKEVIAKVKALNLPGGSYVVFGGGPLAAVGLREVNDIDMYVTPDVWKRMKLEGWKELDKGGKDVPLVHDCFEMHTNWDFSSYNPTLAHLLETAIVVDGVAFAALEEVRKWKLAYNRSKDHTDIVLIDKYLQRSQDGVV
ncbi:MAG TPA: hypothetical protein VJB98_03790 [Candidatus Paceibacterota bacterium]